MGSQRQRDVGRAQSALLGASVTWGFLAGTRGGTEHSSLTQQDHRLLPQPPPLCGPATAMHMQASCILLSAFSNLSPRGFDSSSSAPAPGCVISSGPSVPLHGVCFWDTTVRLDMSHFQSYRPVRDGEPGCRAFWTPRRMTQRWVCTGLATLGSTDMPVHPLWWGLPWASQDAQQCPWPLFTT